MLDNAFDFRQANVLVIGDIMLDQYWLGDTSRLSPEAPVPVLKVEDSQNRLGGAANAALNAKKLGASIGLLGILGDDSNGQLVSQLLAEHEINNQCITCSQANTISKLRLMSRNQQMLRADFEKDFSQQAIEALTDKAETLLEQYDIVLLSDYNKGALQHCQKIITIANKLGKKVIIDPKGNDFSKYQQAFLLTPNLHEFETIVGHCPNEQTLFKKAEQMLQDYNLEALLLTRSEQGMTLFINNEHFHYRAKAQEVFDVTGAGDTVIATLTTALACGIDLTDAVQLANTAAGLTVQKMGAAFITPLELKVASEEKTSALGVTTAEKLAEAVAFEQSLGKKIVFTNGCFDILHAGHVQYLNEAKALGDRLIVAINDDASVKRLKGEQRPINNIEDRMAVMAGLQAADWVVSFSEDTPENLLKLLKPNVLAKGGDYSIDQVVGAEIVQANGGEVSVLSLQEGRSTTRIIDSIQKS